jgi:hypothetical protein
MTEQTFDFKWFACRNYQPGNGAGDGANNGTSPANAWIDPSYWTVPEGLIAFV